MGERIPCTDEVASSILVSSTTISPIAQLVEQSTVNAPVAGSSPARGAMLTVAQMVELQIVVLAVASSILVCQPTAPSSSFGLGRRIVNPVTWVQIPLGPP